MNKRGPWGPMAERVRQSAPPTDVPPPPGVRHCWVTDYDGFRLPGLLLTWRRVGDAWDGRVVRLVRDGEGWVVVEEWLPATMLEGA